MLECGWSIPNRLRQFMDYHHQQHACNRTDSDNQTERIIIPDISEYFSGIQQIINCNRIESGLEFIEKVIFSDQKKDLDRPEQKKSRFKKQAMPASAKNLVRKYCQPQHQRQAEKKCGEQVQVKSNEKGF